MRPVTLMVGCAAILAAPLAAQADYGRVRVPPRPAFADSLPDFSHEPIRFTIADAEAEGARWVHRGEPTSQPAFGADHFANPASRKCTDATASGSYRSGDFVIGGNTYGEPGWQGMVKIWWEPMHPAQSFSLLVRGASLNAARDTLRYVNPGWAIGGSPQVGTTGPIFYASGLTIPSPGRWLVIATSGPDWGCFIIAGA